MTSQGTARGRFQRAIKQGNLFAAELAARELRGLNLDEALDLVALIAKVSRTGSRPPLPLARAARDRREGLDACGEPFSNHGAGIRSFYEWWRDIREILEEGRADWEAYEHGKSK